LFERKQAQKALVTSRNNLQKSKRETDNILENVEEGLFTLNKRYIISSQYSAALSNIFDEDSLAHRKLTDVLHGKIDFGVLNSTVEYLELMFNPDFDERNIEELNPLTQVKFETGGSGTKYLSFNFRRIYNTKRIIALFATVNDITEQINLAKRLEASEAQSKRQMEWLLNIMHVEPELIREFIESAEGEIAQSREILNTIPENGDSIAWIDHLYRSVHLIKGNASLLDLSFFARHAHTCEDDLQLLKNKNQITSTDINKLVRYIEEMQESIDEMRKLIEKISQIHVHFRPKRSYETEKLMQSISNFIRNLSGDLNRKVKFNYSKFDGKILPHGYKLLVKDILIQLVRNSMFHGIEGEKERRKNGKDPTGIISLESSKEGNILKLKYRDDGRGLQIAKLRKSAEKIGVNGESSFSNCKDEDVAKLIFEPGITTAVQSELNAGRGVGMDLVREKVKKHNGSIRVNSTEGKYCEFIISLPLNINGKTIK
jgi:two-component system chemotaxis sensor kinase CheA